MKSNAKKILLSLIAIIITLGLSAVMPVAAHAQENAPTIYVTNAQGKVGDIVDVKVGLRNNPGITSMTIFVSFNKEALSLVDVVDNGKFNIFVPGYNLISPYMLYWRDGAVHYNNMYSGDLATLKFKIESEVGSDITIQYPADEIFNEGMDDVYFAVENSIVTIDIPKADYRAVEAAIATASKLNSSLYTPGSWAVLQNTINAVNYGLSASEQSIVDGYVTAINNAIAALVFIGANYSQVNTAIATANELNSNLYTSGSWAVLQAAIEAVVPGLNINNQSTVDGYAAAINAAIDALVYKGADYSGVEAAIAAANGLNRDMYVDLSGVDAAVSAVVTGLDITSQSIVDGYAAAINAAIDALVYKGADYSRVLAAIAAANALIENQYTPESWAALQAVIMNVNYDLGVNEQSVVDGYETAINNAAAALVYKGADYSGVEAAISRANGLNRDMYVDLSGVDSAVSAVVTGLNITSQSIVDGYAAAINAAIDALVYKGADYSRVLAAIAAANSLVENQYTPESWAALQAVIMNVNYDLGVNEQNVVDGYETAINNASAALVFKAVEITSIAITNLPTKTVYFLGDSVDISNMEVMAYFSDNSSVPVIGYDYNPKTLNAFGTQTITVIYEENTAEFTVEVAVLNGITVEPGTYKVDYFVGDALDLSGMIVKANYLVGGNPVTYREITGYTTDPANGATLMLAGPLTININYSEGGVNVGNHININVNRILETSIVVTNARRHFQMGVQRSIETRARSIEWTWVYEPKFYDAPELIFDVTGYEGPFRLWIGIEDVYPGIYVDVVEYVEDQEDTRNDVSEYFYDVVIPEGVSDAGIYLVVGDDGEPLSWYMENLSEGDTIPLLKGNSLATVVFTYEGEPYTIEFVPDDEEADPFEEIVESDPLPDFEISYILVKTAQAGLIYFDYELRASVTNNGTGAKDVTAVLAKDQQASVTVISGDIVFGDIPAGATVTSLNTFTIRVDRTKAFSESLLNFDFYYSATE